MNAASRASGRRQARWLARVGLIVGLALLGFHAFAPSLDSSASPSHPDAEPAGMAGYDFSATRPEEALGRLSGRGPRASVEELNQLVFESLAHGEPRSISFGQSWLAWCAGCLRPDLRRTQDPRRLLDGGRGLCSDAVIVLAALCSRSGREVEMIDLSGHVVAGVKDGAQTWIADPDLGACYSPSLEELTTPTGLAEVRETLLRAGHPASRVEAVVEALRSTNDNAVVPGGVMSPRLARAERVIGVLDCLLPLGTACLCAAWLAWARRAHRLGLWTRRN